MAKFILDKIHSDEWPMGVIRLQESLQEKSDELKQIAEKHEKAESEEMRKKLEKEYKDMYEQMAQELASKHPAKPDWLTCVELGLNTLGNVLPAIMSFKKW